MTSLAEPKTKTDGLYHHMVDTSGVEAARALALKLLQQYNNNLTTVADMMQTTRPTIRRARDGSLEHVSRRPNTSPNITSTSLEELVLRERKTTGFGRIRMSDHLKRKLGLEVKSTTIQNIYNRAPNLTKQNYSRSGDPKPLHDYEALLPFEEMQLDCKYVEDYQALGKLCFVPRKIGAPSFQWTAIDAKTKTKFLAYSHQAPNALYGQWFMLFVVWWLRAQGIEHEINLQVDNGSEWASGSKKKEVDLNEQLKPYNATLRSIPAGKKYLQGIVERTHRTDDEEFYRPHLGRMKDKEDFLARAQRYQDTFNVVRMHYGRGMNGVSPSEKLEESAVLGAERICAFPVLCIDDLFDGVQDLNYYIDMQRNLNKKTNDSVGAGVKDVLPHYRYVYRSIRRLPC